MDLQRAGQIASRGKHCKKEEETCGSQIFCHLQAFLKYVCPVPVASFKNCNCYILGTFRMNCSCRPLLSGWKKDQSVVAESFFARVDVSIYVVCRGDVHQHDILHCLGFPSLIPPHNEFERRSWACILELSFLFFISLGSKSIWRKRSSIVSHNGRNLQGRPGQDWTCVYRKKSTCSSM